MWLWRKFHCLMKFPVIEIVDRYTIAVVKHEKTNGANQEELDFYLKQMQEAKIDPLNSKVLALIEHHDYVWSLEDDFKKAKIDALPLDQIGARILLLCSRISRLLAYNSLISLMGFDRKLLITLSTA